MCFPFCVTGFREKKNGSHVGGILFKDGKSQRHLGVHLFCKDDWIKTWIAYPRVLLICTVAFSLLRQQQACRYMLIISDFLIIAKSSQTLVSCLVIRQLLSFCCGAPEVVMKPKCVLSPGMPCFPGFHIFSQFIYVLHMCIKRRVVLHSCMLGFAFPKKGGGFCFVFLSLGERAGHACGDMGKTLFSKML